VDARTHWNTIYQTKAPDNVSWHEPVPVHSLALIRHHHPDRSAAVIDVGAGSSALADHLLADGYSDLTLLDISEAALALTQTRLKAHPAARIRWLVGDITSVELPRAAYDVWHDRAVFHFLTEPAQRARYAAQLERSLRPQGLVIMATFALDGPTQCSGLPVMRYDAASLQEALGSRFLLLDATRKTHVTPWTSEQAFLYACLRLRS